MFSRAFFAFVVVSVCIACGAVEDSFADAGECCPRDQVQSGSMNLGGYSETGCHRTHDFWCSTNWRVEKDEHGCEVWRSDRISPAPGENAQCMRIPDAGSD